MGDLGSIDSAEKRSILKSITDSEDSTIAEESRQAVEVRVNPPRSKKYSHHSKKTNGTNKNRDVHIQWFATPSRIVEHHTEGGKLESNIHNYRDNGDFHPDNSAAYQNENHNRHSDHQYHVDHDHNDQSGEGENQNSYSPVTHQNDGIVHDVPHSDVFYKKLKLKKVRRNCTRSKLKKDQKSKGWPDRSDTNVESRLNNGIFLPHINTESLQQNLPDVPEPKFNNIPKPPSYPSLLSGTMGFSGEHLHGIPRTHFFHYKNGEGVNHYHLHNHNHVYDANGKKINLDYSPKHGNLGQHFGKLKSILTATENGKIHSYPQSNSHYRSTLKSGDSESTPTNINGDPQKRGYHYTGTHESYGRKTYKRIYPTEKIPTTSKTITTSSSTSYDDRDKSIGTEMYRYGAGQYGTDEFSSHDKEFYPNEVNYEIDKQYPASGESYNPVRENSFSSYQNTPNSPAYDGYNSLPINSPFTDNADHSFNDGVKTDKYNKPFSVKKPEDKAPYGPQDKAPYTPQNKPAHGHSSIHGSTSGEFHDSYKGPPPSDSYGHPDSQYGHSDSKSVHNGPASSSSPQDLSSKENSGPADPPTVTHSVSYSQDGDIETIDYGPENMHLFQNLRPDPDPLTIPKNAKIFEHYIRLNPIHYMHAALAARRPMNIPANIPSGIPANIPSGVPANIPSGIPPNIPSGISANIPRGISPNIPGSITPNIPGVISATIPGGISGNIPRGISPNIPASIPSRIPGNIRTPYGNAGYPVPLHKYPPGLMPKYPVPLHKLIPNPLKMPMFPVAPLYPRVPAPYFNQMLMYHGSSLYPRWW